jgi:PucR-like helix-turn-helix protein/diguanylate cyclase with GGDEF domain
VGVVVKNRDGPGEGPGDDLDALRAILLTRLGARGAEVEAAIVAAALEIEPSVGGDPEGLAGLKAAARETVELVEELIAQGVDWTPRLPPAVAAQARFAARSGVTLDAVMRTHYATTSLCLEFATSETDTLPAGTLPYLIEIQSKHGDYLMGAASAAYESELERVASPGARRLEQRIDRLLAGDAAGTAGLDYDLEAWHLGLIGVGPEVELILRRLSEQLGCRLLLVPKGGETAWAWLGAARPVPFEELERYVRDADAEVTLATGEPRRGFEGWRLSHREARTAQEVAPRRPRSLTRCADVLLLAATLRDPEVSRMLVDVYLAPLDSHSGGAALRETLRAYYASDCNSASAAASLGVDRQTVRRRLRRVEEAIGRRLDGCRVEMEMALRVEDHGR